MVKLPVSLIVITLLSTTVLLPVPIPDIAPPEIAMELLATTVLLPVPIPDIAPPEIAMELLATTVLLPVPIPDIAPPEIVIAGTVKVVPLYSNPLLPPILNLYAVVS